MQKIFILIFLFFFHIIQIHSLNLEMVAQVFRHGHRYSVFSFFNNTEIKPGQLTEEGKNSAFAKGIDFRNRNYGLLSDEKETDVKNIMPEIKSYCSKKRRNIVSLFMRLKGLYPNLKIYDNLEELNDTNLMNFLSENFNTEFPNDLMFNVLENLKCRSKIEQRLSMTKKLDNINFLIDHMAHDNEDIFNNYFEAFPKDMHTYIKVFYVADYLERHIENKIKISPSEYKLKELLTGYYKLIVDITAEEPSLIRIFTSRIYETILSEFEANINKSNTHKLVLFSAHDVTMSAFIHSINADVRDYHYDFNDEINFVLIELGEEYYISIKYNNEEIPLKFCKNKKLCEYETFKKFVEESFSSEEDIEQFCRGELEVLTKENNEKIKNEI